MAKAIWSFRYVHAPSYVSGPWTDVPTEPPSHMPCQLVMSPNEVWETYCVCSVSYYYITPTVHVLLFYVSFSLVFLLFFFHTFLSARFLGDALMKLYESLLEYHMPCEVVLLRFDFFKMAAVAMETTKMLKKTNTKMIIADYRYSPNRN